MLLFTKSLGTGVISTAIKKGKAEPAWIDAAVQSMTTLNKFAAEVIAAGDYAVHGMTDITGFGMIGHAREMALGSDVSLRIEARAVPALPGALECIRQGFIPGGLNNNREFAECLVTYADDVPDGVANDALRSADGWRTAHFSIRNGCCSTSCRAARKRRSRCADR